MSNYYYRKFAINLQRRRVVARSCLYATMARRWPASSGQARVWLGRSYPRPL